MQGTRIAVKRVLLGRPRTTRELEHQLLPKRVGFPAFASDQLSSVAYATEELLVVLAVAGAGALAVAPTLALAVAALIGLTVVSYRAIVRAYPHGGGAYAAATDTLGRRPGLVAAGAALVTHALTVAVSVAAAVAALVAVLPALDGQRALVALALLAAVTFASLRGVREAGLLVAVPVYAFIVVIGLLVLLGLARCAVDGCPAAASAGTDLPAVEALTVPLLARAVAAGGVAAVGVEGISNGVTTFRYPQSDHAARTLAIMGAVAVALFLGVTALANATGVRPDPGTGRTVLAEVAVAVVGEGVGLAVVQAATVAILLVAASGSFMDFPRLASVLARDRLLPQQYLARGDRLVFTNGNLLLAGGAAAALVGSGASVTALAHLYVVAAFTAFALAQTGMARRGLRERRPGSRRRAGLHAVGAGASWLVLAVALVAGLALGTWAVVLAVGALITAMRAIRRHYEATAARLDVERPGPPVARHHHAVILLDRVDEAAARSLSYVLSTEPTSVRALAAPLPGTDLPARWATLAPDVPLEILVGAKDPRSVDAVAEALVEEAERAGPEAFTTAVIPETLSRSWVEQLREHRLALRLKARLHAEGRVVVTDITSPTGGPGPYTVEEPAEHHVVVLANTLDAATLRALSYAESLHASSVRALKVSLDRERTTDLLARWRDWGIATPIEVVDSPFRSLSATARAYLREFAPDGRHTVVTCVVPEVVLGPRAHASLHNQSPVLLRGVLLFERGIVTTTVPFPLRAGSAVREPAATQRER